MIRPTKPPSALVLLFACGVVLTALPPGASGEPADGKVAANARVGAENPDPFRGDDIPAVAADPGDPHHIVMVNDNFVTGECEFRATFDGGIRWEGGKLKAPAGFPSPPCRTLSSGGYPHVNQSVAFGTGQNVYTVFDSPKGPQQVYGAPSFGQGQADSVLVARSSDGGRSFNTAVVAIAAPDGAPFPFYIRSTLGVQARPDGDRLFVAAWGVAVTSGGPADGAGERRLVTASSATAGPRGRRPWTPPLPASRSGNRRRPWWRPTARSMSPGATATPARPRPT
jgi:hypothetical protein